VVFSLFVSICMSPTRSGYKDLGLEVVDPLEDHHCRSRWISMAEEKRDDGAGDIFKLLLEEALM
jgi:hypothetical protein